MLSKKELEKNEWRELTDGYYLKGNYSLNVNDYNNLITIVDDRGYKGVLLPISREDSGVVRYQGICEDMETLHLIENLIEINEFREPTEEWYENKVTEGTAEDEY